jgi:hypothetical protein
MRGNDRFQGSSPAYNASQKHNPRRRLGALGSSVSTSHFVCICVQLLARISEALFYLKLLALTSCKFSQVLASNVDRKDIGSGVSLYRGHL